MLIFFQESIIPHSLKEVLYNQPPSVPKDYLISEKDFCIRRKPKVIVLVTSAVYNVDRREKIRKTWGDSTNFGVIFMIGRSKNEEEQKVLNLESKLYHDIAQGNYTDTYDLLPYKTISGFYWAVTYCEKAPWVIHCDDDVIINESHVLKELIEDNENVILGNLNVKPETRRNTTKWILSYEEYPCVCYPNYVSGAFWIASMSVIKKLYNVIPKVNFIKLEDVYSTGLLAEAAQIKQKLVPILMGKYSFIDSFGNYLAWIQ